LFDDAAGAASHRVSNAPMAFSDSAYHLAVDLGAGRPPGHWLLRVPHSLDAELIQDLYVVCGYDAA
jgi:hypothetical protein